MTLGSFPSAWLAWARRIFTTPESHLVACRSAGGDQHQAVDLNPGFVGLRYPEHGGVLCLGLANGQSPPEVRWQGETRRDLARRWLGGDPPIDDEAFFRQWQTDFAQEVETWPYWAKHFSPVLEPLGLEPSDVSHTNLAPCRMRATGRGQALALLCSNQHPIAELLAILHPTVILVATQLGEVSRGLVRVQGLDPLPLVLAWHGQNFTLDGEPRRTWLSKQLPHIGALLTET